MIAVLRHCDAFFCCALLHLGVVGLRDLLALFRRLDVAHPVAHRSTLIRGHQLLARLRGVALGFCAVAALTADLRETGGMVTIEGRAAGPYASRPQLLKRCLANLLENAIKYGTSAKVVVDYHADRLQISILDQGPGLPVDQLSRVFEPFYRVEGSRNRDTGGTGLGLAIAKNVAELHGGRIELRNRPEGALAVILVLPC